MPQRSTLTLHDIADLARVERAVVSMWRRRPSVMPFPEAVAWPGGVERFERDEVVAYLLATGRGNNDDVELDAVALSVPDDVAAEDVVTLLALHVATGAELSGLDTADLAELAREADPRDGLFLREVVAMTVTDDLTGYLDDLVEASYGASDALARVDAGRLRRGVRGLTEDLVALVAAVTRAARAAVVGDGTGDVVLAPDADPVAFRRLVDGFAGVVLDPNEQRAWRRRALIDDVDAEPPTSLPLVRFRSVVELPRDEALDRADGLVVELGPRDVGIVLGAASALCDPLMGDAVRVRDTTLDGRALAAAIRLPRGLWKGAHRQSLGLWVLRGARDQELVSVADLENAPVDPEDLASDVAAALLEPTADSITGRRAPRYARRVEYATVQGRGSVVPRGTVAVRLGDTGGRSHLDRVTVSTLTTSRGVPGCDVAVAPSRGAITSRRRSLGELAVDRLLVLRRGVRIDPAHADPDGTVPVLSADGSSDHLRLDPLAPFESYPRATRTEPGDVVILEKPRPRARVDVDGGALVCSPSRILRLQAGAPVGPHTLAATIEAFAAVGTAWTTWTVPLLPRGEAAALDVALADVVAHRRELHRHLDATGELLAGLIEGVAAGAVTLDPTVIEQEAG